MLVKSDNTTVVSHINRMGGMKSPLLVCLVKELWQWCLQRTIQLRAEHLPGKENLMADFLSRHLRDRSVWILNRENDQPEAGSIGPGSACNEIFNTASPLYQLVPRSSSGGNRCISPRMEDGARICPPPLVPYSVGPMQSADGRSYSGYSCPSMAESDVVPTTGGDANRLPHPSSMRGRGCRFHPCVSSSCDIISFRNLLCYRGLQDVCWCTINNGRV